MSLRLQSLLRSRLLAYTIRAEQDGGQSGHRKEEAWCQEGDRRAQDRLHAGPGPVIAMAFGVIKLKHLLH